MQAGLIIADARQRAGLSLRELADRAHTSAPTLSAYENGTKEPSWSTVERVVRAAGFAPVVTLERDAAEGPEYSALQLSRDLRAASERERLRLVLEFVDRFHDGTPAARRRQVANRPLNTGDQRWDALVAGLVEHLCWHADLPAPSWVNDPARFLDALWWPIEGPLFRIWALTDAPAGLMRHGVMLSRRDLERV